jgi:hypothetical protein
MAETALAPSKQQKLDDVMIAMDVVDMLRHREDLVRRELDNDGRERELIARLRQIYHDQGIEVPDHVLAEGSRRSTTAVLSIHRRRQAGSAPCSPCGPRGRRMASAWAWPWPS